ncbi:MAG: hypothetical protein RLZZ209_180, partial [Bacteroidota bacterium]
MPASKRENSINKNLINKKRKPLTWSSLRFYQGIDILRYRRFSPLVLK